MRKESAQQKIESHNPHQPPATHCAKPIQNAPTRQIVTHSEPNKSIGKRKRRQMQIGGIPSIEASIAVRIEKIDMHKQSRHPQKPASEQLKHQTY